ncbi:prostaglandin F2-alpha receptor-like [Ylistrum balloti]|uniref:prostaglandin F2-alpha receptor-like n=1 Tax=Ylistrum balloti TaxID=509963 RepID=UPI002905B925|nr:prostaglandin F2-alpha receptor-like [Ylistrum balloti]
MAMNALNISVTNDTTIPDERLAVVLSVIFVFIPGCLLNIIAIFIIVKDFKTLQTPTNTLLFLLILFDLIALFNSYMWLVIDKNYSIPALTCQIKKIINPLFLFYTGILSLVLAIDRYIALNFAFFYRTRISFKLWLYVAFAALLFSLFIGSLPLMGYGSSYEDFSNHRLQSCGSFDYEKDPLKRVFGITQPSIGLIVIICIVIFNTLTIRTVLQMKMRIRAQELQMGQGHLPSHEILFANLVTVMTLGFIVCWTPFNIMNILESTGQLLSPSLKALMHSITGLSFCIDPLLYVWIRKSVRKKVVAAFRNCIRCKHSSDPNLR